ncbi:MAG: gephyrin-like molybdotransferase Glp [Dokdonella sp.]
MPSSDSPAEFPTHLSVDAARARVAELCLPRRLATESVDLECALGRILASDLIAPHDLPPFANSAMDGYALRGTDLPARGEAGFRVAGCVLAGSAHAPRFGSGECLRITTGAPLPAEADTVVMKEKVRVEGDFIIVDAGQRAGANVRSAGEDYRAGENVLRAGDRLSAARLGVLAACGHATTQVTRLPRVALFVTGDELVPPDRALGFGQIHDSNRYSLGGLLQGLGIEPSPVAHLRDDPDTIRVALRKAGERSDVIISSGGVSAGEADFMPSMIAELGRVHFWKVRMKPGMPVLCGEVGGAIVFALPGNPVSSIATFLTLVRPALLALQGASPVDGCSTKARLAVGICKQHDRTEFVRVRVQPCDDGACWATPLPAQGSGMLRGVAEADALMILPEHVFELAVGDVVDVMLLPGIIW